MFRSGIKRSLSFQIALAISLLIFFIEGVLLVFSLNHRHKELHKKKEYVERKIEEKTGKKIVIYSDQFIKNELKIYTRNIVILTLIIALVVVTGTVSLFHFIAGRHILKLKRINEATKLNDIKLYPEKHIPPNEVGDNIKVRNDMVRQIKKSHQILSNSKSVFELARITNKVAHEILNPLNIIVGRSELLLE